VKWEAAEKREVVEMVVVKHIMQRTVNHLTPMLLLLICLLVMLAESLEAVDTEALTRHLPNVAAAVSKLHLTPAQQQAIAGLWKVWSALLVPVNKEIAELQQQIQELSCQDSGAVNSSSSSTSEAGGKGAMSAAAAAAVEPEAAVEAPHAAATPNGSVSSSVRLAASVSHRAAFIETQMQLADRLQVRGVRGAGFQSDSWGGASPGPPLDRMPPP